MLNLMLNILIIFLEIICRLREKKIYELFDKIDYLFMICYIVFLSGKYDKFC